MRDSKYLTVKRRLRAELLAGGFPHGEPLPSEALLAAGYGVSRMTLRRATDELEAEGLLYRVQGAGTFPTGQGFPQGTLPVRSFGDWGGAQATVTLRRRQVTAAGPDVSALLRVPAGTAVLFVERVLWAGTAGEPLALERLHLEAAALGRGPGETAPDPEQQLQRLRDLRAPDLLGSLLASGVPMTRTEQHLGAVNLRSEEAQLLKVPGGTAALRLSRVCCDGPRRVAHLLTLLRGDHSPFYSALEL